MWRFRNKHKGRAAVVLGTGETLNRFDPATIKEWSTCLRIGVKGIIQTRAYDPLDYYVFGDFNERSLSWMHLVPKLQVRQAKICLTGGLSTVTREWAKRAGATLVEMEKGDFRPDLLERPLPKLKSTGLFAAILAIHVGCRRIYLVGCDCNRVASFVDPRIGRSQDNADEMLKRWQEFAAWHRSHMRFRKVDIISVNPVELKGLFRDVAC